MADLEGKVKLNAGKRRRNRGKQFSLNLGEGKLWFILILKGLLALLTHFDRSTC